MVTRRDLPPFADLSDAVADARSLATSDYDRVGRWDLAQVARHLAAWVKFPMDGFPPAPLPLRPVMFVLRKTIAPKMLREALSMGKMKPGMGTAAESLFLPGGDPAAAIDEFDAAIRRWRGHIGPTHPSPFFGPLTREQLDGIHALHAAHHLSFLLPRR